MEIAGIPPRYQEAHLATNCTPLESAIGKDQALAQARRWSSDGYVTQRGRDRFCMLVTGGYGVGKTWLATAAFKELLWRSPSGIWRKFHAFIREIQGCYSDGSSDRVDEVLRRYQRTPVLMLDDVGDLTVGTETDDRRRLLYEVLDVRNDYLLPTIITTNLNDEELAAQFGERTFERVKEMAALVGMSGKNYRDQ
jgi:DNA replication protein DnaC